METLIKTESMFVKTEVVDTDESSSESISQIIGFDESRSECKTEVIDIGETIVCKTEVIDIDESSKINNSKFVCDICNKSITSEWYLIEHRLRHAGQRSRRSDAYCNDSPKKKHSMTSDNRDEQIRIKRYSCDNCNRCFAYFQGLMAHQCNQLRERDKTDFISRRKSLLDLYHSRFDDFDTTKTRCGICCLNFDHNIAYLQHMEQHKNVHLCVKCNKLFERNKQLCDHLKEKHNMIACRNCPQIFYSPSNYSHHNVQKHKSLKNWECEMCTEVYFTSYDSLIAHYRGAHNIRCDSCNIGFDTAALLNAHHMAMHQDLQFSAREKKFTLLKSSAMSRPKNSVTVLRTHVVSTPPDTSTSVATILENTTQFLSRQPNTSNSPIIARPNLKKVKDNFMKPKIPPSDFEKKLTLLSSYRTIMPKVSVTDAPAVSTSPETSTSVTTSFENTTRTSNQKILNTINTLAPQRRSVQNVTPTISIFSPNQGPQQSVIYKPPSKPQFALINNQLIMMSSKDIVPVLPGKSASLSQPSISEAVVVMNSQNTSQKSSASQRKFSSSAAPNIVFKPMASSLELTQTVPNSGNETYTTEKQIPIVSTNNVASIESSMHLNDQLVKNEQIDSSFGQSTLSGTSEIVHLLQEKPDSEFDDIEKVIPADILFKPSCEDDYFNYIDMDTDESNIAETSSIAANVFESKPNIFLKPLDQLLLKAENLLQKTDNLPQTSISSNRNVSNNKCTSEYTSQLTSSTALSPSVEWSSIAHNETTEQIDKDSSNNDSDLEPVRMLPIIVSVVGGAGSFSADSIPK